MPKQIITPGIFSRVEGTDIEVGVGASVGHNVVLEIEEFTCPDGRPYVEIRGLLNDGTFAVRAPKESDGV